MILREAKCAAYRGRFLKIDSGKIGQTLGLCTLKRHAEVDSSHDSGSRDSLFEMLNFNS